MIKPFIHSTPIIFALVFSSNAVAGIGVSENNQAVCYFFKNNKLSQQANCAYDTHTGVEFLDTAVERYELLKFYPSNKSVLIYHATYYGIDGKDNGKKLKSVVTINDSQARFYYRNSSLKTVSQKPKHHLSCYKNAQMDFCYQAR